MTTMVEFPLEGGGTVVVGVADESFGGAVTRGLGRGEVVERAQQTFEQATDGVVPVARAILRKLQDVGEGLDEIHIEFGVELRLEVGAIIASGSTGAHFTVGLTWHRHSTALQESHAE
jgi:hypothetical protein